MAVTAAFVMPHPPLAVPQVGQGREEDIAATVAAMDEVAQAVAELAPDTIVILSPHAPAYLDYLQISAGRRARGDFERFGAPQPSYAVDYDTAFARALADRALADGLRAGTEGRSDGCLDHGFLVPLHFLQKRLAGLPTQPRYVRIGLSGLSALDHYRLGVLIEKTAEAQAKDVVIIASGDNSHKLAEDGPYGYAEEGPIFDAAMERILSEGDFLALLDFDPDLAERAAECGLRSFQIMAGAFEGTPVDCRVLSHEGPFGVGYIVAEVRPTGPHGTDPDREFIHRHLMAREEARKGRLAQEDAMVRVARRALEGSIRDLIAMDGRQAMEGAGLDAADPLVAELREPAACFVSIKKDGRLRGCIGTLSPTQPTLADEIAHNAVAAATRDPRFNPVEPGELAELVYDVDVLGAPEPVESREALDPKRYGVVVSASRGRRGVLLPDLAGVDTVEEQLTIAASKGHIDLDRDAVTLERFTVVRHL